MNNCTGCKHAIWNKTASGRLHPSGDGKCTFEIRIPELPASKYWYSKPRTSGGHINRREDLPEHCKYFIRDGD